MKLIINVCNREGDCVPARNMPHVELTGNTVNINDDDLSAVIECLTKASDRLGESQFTKWEDNFDLTKQRNKR